MGTPSQIKAGLSPFGPKDTVKVNRGLNEIAAARKKQYQNDLNVYNTILKEEGWKVNPEGIFYEINNSEIGKGAPFYVDKNLNMHNLRERNREHTPTWIKSKAVSEKEDLHIPHEVAAAARRNSRRRATRRRATRRRATRRRASRKHRRTYRK
jgi:hypothetical protein